MSEKKFECQEEKKNGIQKNYFLRLQGEFWDGGFFQCPACEISLEATCKNQTQKARKRVRK